MSLKLPKTDGRMASSSNAPAKSVTAGFCKETAKWLDQKCTKCSTNGAGVVSAFSVRAFTAAR